MTTAPRFWPDAEGAWTIGRAVLGFAATAWAVAGNVFVCAGALVLCVWADALGGYLARRHGTKSASTVALESLADATCFVAAPVALTCRLASSPRIGLSIGLIVFLAALWRLARFQVEGLEDGRYAGLPVTYNGYVFPAATLLVSLLPAWRDLLLAILGLTVSVLMIARRLRIPEL